VSQSNDCYSILCVPRNASNVEIKEAFYAKAPIAHSPLA